MSYEDPWFLVGVFVLLVAIALRAKHLDIESIAERKSERLKEQLKRLVAEDRDTVSRG